MAETEYLIYENLFAKKEDIEDFVLEGKADITFENGCMRMKNALEASLGRWQILCFGVRRNSQRISGWNGNSGR